MPSTRSRKNLVSEITTTNKKSTRLQKKDKNAHLECDEDKNALELPPSTQNADNKAKDDASNAAGSSGSERTSRTQKRKVTTAEIGKDKAPTTSANSKRNKANTKESNPEPESTAEAKVDAKSVAARKAPIKRTIPVEKDTEKSVTGKKAQQKKAKVSSKDSENAVCKKTENVAQTVNEKPEEDKKSAVNKENNTEKVDPPDNQQTDKKFPRRNKKNTDPSAAASTSPYKRPTRGSNKAVIHPVAVSQPVVKRPARASSKTANLPASTVIKVKKATRGKKLNDDNQKSITKTPQAQLRTHSPSNDAVATEKPAELSFAEIVKKCSDIKKCSVVLTKCSEIKECSVVLTKYNVEKLLQAQGTTQKSSKSAAETSERSHSPSKVLKSVAPPVAPARPQRTTRGAIKKEVKSSKVVKLKPSQKELASKENNEHTKPSGSSNKSSEADREKLSSVTVRKDVRAKSKVDASNSSFKKVSSNFFPNIDDSKLDFLISSSKPKKAGIASASSIAKSPKRFDNLENDEEDLCGSSHKEPPEKVLTSVTPPVASARPQRTTRGAIKKEVKSSKVVKSKPSRKELISKENNEHTKPVGSSNKSSEVAPEKLSSVTVRKDVRAKSKVDASNSSFKKVSSNFFPNIDDSKLDYLISSSKPKEAGTASASSVLKSPNRFDKLDDDDEDPYDFNSSQTEPTHKKQKKPRKKPSGNKQLKPGNKFELLMQQKVLNAVEFSCNVQNDPARYEAEKKNLEKRIKVPEPSIPKVALDSPLRRSIPIVPIPRNDQTNRKTTLDQPFHSKVWHSPKAVNSAQKSLEKPAVAFVSDSPPIQSAFAKKMAEVIKANVNRNSTTPLRVTGNLPSAFYMELSRIDGSPTFSSDLVEKTRAHDVNAKKLENSIEQVSNSSKSSDAGLSKSSESDDQAASILGDSNAENMAPSDFEKLHKTRKPKNVLRSPLKALQLSSLTSPLATNRLIDQLKNNSATILSNESTSIHEVLENRENSFEMAGAQSKALRHDPDTRDTFGFDELIANDRSFSIPCSSRDVEVNFDISDRLNNMKRYLPSKNNKNRDKDVFPTSPTKKIRLLESPKKTVLATLPQFFSASTPVGKAARQSLNQFGNTSVIDDSSLATTQAGEDHESNLELFKDNSELYNSHRQYTKRKHIPKFLMAAEELNSDSDDEPDTRKKSTKQKRKKYNIEETVEFEKFVHDKTSEFAEVDEYEMVVE